MSFPTLALVGVVALAGPLLAAAGRWRLPLVLGELIAGIVIGASGLHLVNATDPTFTFLADIGFALTMFVAGTHVPVRDARLRPALLGGVLRALLVGVLATGAAVGIAALLHTGHPAVFAVLMASSSAALVLPAFGELGLGGPAVLGTLAQVAVADTACIIALPLAIDPANAPRAALGALIIAVCAVGLFLLLRWADRGDRWHRFRKLSHERHLALELRISLIVLFALAAIAATMHVSVMLAGFAAGLAVAAVGEPRRLARQLFALTDGFAGPIFFVWLGASLALGALIQRPQFILLGLLLGLGAIVAHGAMRLAREPLPLAVAASAQLGVPVAAATIGKQTGLLSPGEPAALILGALVSIAALTASTAIAARNPKFRPPEPAAAPAPSTTAPPASAS